MERLLLSFLVCSGDLLETTLPTAEFMSPTSVIRLRSLALLLVCPTFAGCSKDLAFVDWPTNERPVIRVEFFEENLDGYDEKRALLKGTDFDLFFGDARHWESGENIPQRFSCCLQSVQAEGVTLGIAEFSKDEFLPDLSDAVWSTYIDSLETKSPSKEITYQHSSVDSREPPIILDSVYRQVDYVFESPSGEMLKSREVFAEIEDKLYVFVFSGPVGEIDHFRSIQNLSLSRMSLIKHSF